MDHNLERIRENVRRAETEDLLDRVTVYRPGMEADAVAIIETELDQRGVTIEEIQAHDANRRAGMIELPDGSAQRCSFCYRPAVVRGWGWHRLWGKLPLFPRYFSCCEGHRGNVRRPPLVGEPS